MGAILRFLEEGRAYVVACALSDAGHAVEWLPSAPNMIATSATRRQARWIAAETAGVDDRWYTRAAVDSVRRDPDGGRRSDRRRRRTVVLRAASGALVDAYAVAVDAAGVSVRPDVVTRDGVAYEFAGTPGGDLVYRERP